MSERTIKAFRKYSISEDGIVKALKNNRVKRTIIDKGGYERVILYDEHMKRHNLQVHRLVAEAFIKKVPGKTFINHKDGVKTNNKVNNLEWCSIAENNWHKRNILGARNGSDKKKVLCIETGEIFASILEATKVKKLNKGDISHAINGSSHHKTAGGCHWKLLEGVTNV